MFILFVFLLITGSIMFALGKMKEEGYLTIGGFSTVILSIILFICSLFYIVQPGQVGVEILFGKVIKYSPSGMNGKNPLASVVKLDLRTIKYETKLEGASKDLQEIGVDIAINYRLDYAKIAELYNTVGIDYEVKVINPAVMNLAKAAISQFPIADVIVRRNELSKVIYDSLKDRLAQYFIVLETVNLNNISFAKAFSAAVEEKQVQEQGVQTAEYKRQQAMKQKETTILEAQAESEKQRLLRNTTSKEVIDLKWIEKWNGQLPTYMMGNAVPIVNIGKE